MKLRQIVIDESTLTLTKERKQKKFGEVFDVSDERGAEILAATFKGYPVAEIVNEETKKNLDEELATEQVSIQVEEKSKLTSVKSKSKGGKK